MADAFSLTTEHFSTINRKRCKKTKIADTKEVEEEEEVKDRISMLPDEVLCEILAFMPTKCTVRASILSRRWKYLWTYVPNLDFSCHVNCISMVSFMHFVDRVLSLHNSSLARNFCLRCEQDCPVSFVERCITATLDRNIMNLDLAFPESNLVENIDQGSRLSSLLPSSFFNRRNLVCLRLSNIALKVPASICCCFPSLGKMIFNSVQFLDDDSLKNFLSGCPVLKSLGFCRKAWDNAGTLYITSSTLEVLYLFSTCRCVNKDFGYRFVIEAPCLAYLHVTDLDDLDYVVNNLSSLGAAFINILDNDAQSPHSNVFAKKLFEFFRKISHIKHLCLGSGTLFSLEDASFENLPMFNHLKHLELQFADCYWRILPYLLHCSPNLVGFVFHKIFDHHIGLSGLNCEWFSPHCVPKCLSASLQDTEIRGFEECDAMMGLIEYILKNAMVLKKLSISSQNF